MLSSICLFVRLVISLVVNVLSHPREWKNFYVSARLDWACRDLESVCSVCGQKDTCDPCLCDYVDMSDGHCCGSDYHGMCCPVCGSW